MVMLFSENLLLVFALYDALSSPSSTTSIPKDPRQFLMMSAQLTWLFLSERYVSVKLNTLPEASANLPSAFFV